MVNDRGDIICLVNKPHAFSCILQLVRLPVIIVAYAIKRYLAHFWFASKINSWDALRLVCFRRMWHHCNLRQHMGHALISISQGMQL